MKEKKITSFLATGWVPMKRTKAAMLRLLQLYAA